MSWSSGFLLLAIVGAAAICPLAHLITRRRGGSAGCGVCPPDREDRESTLRLLQQRQRDLADAIEKLSERRERADSTAIRSDWDRSRLARASDRHSPSRRQSGGAGGR